MFPAIEIQIYSLPMCTLPPLWGMFPFNPSNFQALQKKGGQPHLSPQI